LQAAMNAIRSELPAAPSRRHRRKRRSLVLAVASALLASSLASAEDVSTSPFHLGLSEPAKVIQLGDLDVRIFTFATMDIDRSQSSGAQGWSIAIGTRGCEIVWASTNETAAAPDNIGGRRDRGFEKTELVEIDGVVYAWSVVVLSLIRPVTLDPTGSPHYILQLAVELPRRDGAPCEECTLFYAQRQDLQAPVVTSQNETVQPSTSDRTYELCRVPFRRGDANTDGRVDISDAIRIVMYLFLGQTYMLCNDAADTDDSGELDISDPIHLLDDFFRAGTSIPAPGPFACGADPTPERLDCETYPAC